MAFLASTRRSLFRLRGSPTRNLLLVIGCLAYICATFGLFFLQPFADGSGSLSGSTTAPGNNFDGDKVESGSAPIDNVPVVTRPPVRVHQQGPFLPSDVSSEIIKSNEDQGLCLTVLSDINGHGCNNVGFRRCAQEPGQVWRRGSSMLIRNPALNVCLDVWRNEENVHACPCHGQTNQMFKNTDENALQVQFGSLFCVGPHATIETVAAVSPCSEVEYLLVSKPASWFSSAQTVAAFKTETYKGVGSYGLLQADGTITFADEDMMKHVRGMMSHSWDNYVRYAWGADELRPLSRSKRNWLGTGLAATIVDSLDTLYIMGLHEEFAKAMSYVREELSFDVNTSLSFFETTIRDLGGLLSAYALSGDQRLLDLAKDLGDRLLKGFNTQTKMPHAVINLATGDSSLQGWSPTNFILAEVGTVQLEFKLLSHYTNDPVYADKAMAALEYVFSLSLPDRGMYPVFLGSSPGPHSHVGADYTLGGLSDSFYEYLLKQWLWSNRTEPALLEKYLESVDGIEKFLVNAEIIDGETVRYLGKYKGGSREHKMEHLACFAGGMLAMGAQAYPSSKTAATMQLAEDVTYSCRLSYAHQRSGVGPEKFYFENGAAVPDMSSRYYILRPEYVESLFYLWRFTKDVKYRQWGYDVIQALDKSCRLETGYSGIENVAAPGTGYTDIQESFFMAETLKYLYLLFADDNLIHLDEWVFNTEAHPLPVVGKSPVPYPRTP